MIRIIGIRENPEYLKRGTDYIYGAWGNKTNRPMYYDCIKNSITTDSPLPRWYLMLKGDDIIGCYGLITNDFISRGDLWPWLCALHVSEGERGQALGGKLLEHGRREAAKLGYQWVYLCTNHDGYYEKYGWTRMEDGYDPKGNAARIYKNTTILE